MPEDKDEKEYTGVGRGITFLSLVFGLGVASVTHNLGWGLIAFVLLFLAMSAFVVYSKK